MERNAHYLLVGSFVAAALTLGTIMLLLVAGSYEGAIYKRYSVYFQGSVSGLSEGSNVSYRGVGVGHVLSIQFDPKQPEKVKAIIEVDENTPISSSSVVSLQSVGITGLSALAIKTENAEGVPLTVREGEKYPVIPSELSGLKQLLSDAPQITDNAIEALVRINKLLSEKNLENIDSSLENISLASERINNLLDEDTAKSIRESIDGITKTSTRVNSLLSKKNINKVATTIEKINSIAIRFDKILLNNETQLENFTGDNLDEISTLVKETQEMVNSFKILAQKLSDDPSQIIYKPNYGGVKVKQ